MPERQCFPTWIFLEMTTVYVYFITDVADDAMANGISLNLVTLR